jgi:hypothetical protein
VKGNVERLSKKGELDRLKIGVDRNHRTIVCGLSVNNEDAPCDDNNEIFSLTTGKPNTVLKTLLRNMKTTYNPYGITQSSDDEIVIDFKASIEQQSINR